MPLIRPLLLAAFVVTVAPLRASATAQDAGCTAATRPVVALEAGAVVYEVAGGVSGVALGLDGAVPVGGVVVELGYRKVNLRATTTSPDVMRGSVRAALAGIGRWRICGAAHGGTARFVADAGRGSVVAGGIGVGVARAATVQGRSIAAHVEARGLGARADGEVLDTDVAGSGVSLGVEAGARVPVGSFELRLAGSVDGFAPGLGVTPYPARSLRLGLGYRF